ncbi:hypothetical protein MHYP_G00125800 [Metynnis hypsauchen]
MLYFASQGENSAYVQHGVILPSTTWDKTAPSPLSNVSVCKTKERAKQMVRPAAYNHTNRSFNVVLYVTPTVVSVALPVELQSPVTQFCLEQKFHAGANRHVWAVDFLQLLPVLPGAHTHMTQFSVNLGCGSYQPANSVNLEFSTNHGRSWSLLHTECLPELCSGPHLPHSTIYSSENYSGWTRISIPLPNAALTESTQFRWRQTGSGTGNMWAIDNGDLLEWQE